LYKYIPVGKIDEKAVFKSVFLTTWHYILGAELTKTHSFRLFFGDLRFTEVYQPYVYAVSCIGMPFNQK